MHPRTAAREGAPGRARRYTRPVPRRFACLGLSAADPDVLRDLARRAAADAAEIEVPGGTCAVWSAGDGPELWMHFDRRGGLTAMLPHFAGPGRVPVGLVRRVRRTGQGPLEGSWYAWADPPADDLTDGKYPFLFDCPDFALLGDLELPCAAVAQIAAFARDLEVYASPADFEASQREPRLASQSFVPTGLVLPAGEREPQPTALFAGHVIAAELREHPLGGPYLHAQVLTYGGTLDVLAAPDRLPALPRPGGVVSGSAWLSGQLRAESD